MANLDTLAKRASGMNVVATSFRLMPKPTGTIGVGPRQHAAMMYSGILTSTSTAKPWIYSQHTFTLGVGIA